MGCRRRRADLMAATGLATPMEHRPLKPGADTREHLVVIGNGMAGCRAVEELLARDPTRYRVTLFGAEPRVNSNRTILSHVSAGEQRLDAHMYNNDVTAEQELVRKGERGMCQ